MTDDTRIKQPQDPTKVNQHQPWELDYWSKKFGISKAELVAIIAIVGVNVKDIREYLNRKR